MFYVIYVSVWGRLVWAGHTELGLGGTFGLGVGGVGCFSVLMNASV